MQAAKKSIKTIYYSHENREIKIGGNVVSYDEAVHVCNTEMWDCNVAFNRLLDCDGDMDMVEKQYQEIKELESRS